MCTVDRLGSVGGVDRCGCGIQNACSHNVMVYCMKPVPWLQIQHEANLPLKPQPATARVGEDDGGQCSKCLPVHNTSYQANICLIIYATKYPSQIPESKEHPLSRSLTN